jgi:anti-anti-sigma factor
MHTLILIGELDRASAHTLEKEIEQLCAAGTSGITLDLRKLTHIDMTGVAVIAFRSGLYERRGYDFALIPGPWFIQRVFEQAGVVERLPFLYAEEYAIHEGPAVAEMPEPEPAAAFEQPLVTVKTIRGARARASFALPIRSFALLRVWQSQRGSASS